VKIRTPPIIGTVF